MADWTFEFIDSTASAKDENAEKLSSQIPDTLGSGIQEKASASATTKNKETFSSEFTKKIENDAVSTYIVSPLNSVTGGLASPIYQSAKKLSKPDANLKAIGGDLLATGIMMVISTGITHIQNRLEKLEKEVAELGNADNALIRAGSVSTATYYSSNLFGVKSKTDRS